MNILVTGGTGMVGSAFKKIKTDHRLILVGSKDYDLRLQSHAEKMIIDHQPDAIIHLAARVGGVKGNTDYVADFFHENILINTNVLNSAQVNKIPRVVSLLSTCIYPDKANYPLTPDQIHLGPPHKSNFGYAYAKRMLDVQSRAIRQQHGLNYTTVVPNNLYGLNDNFDLENGHVIPAMIRKIWEGKNRRRPVALWGDGSPLREFTYASDISKILFLLATSKDDLSKTINIGNTGEHSIRSIAEKICNYFHYSPLDIQWDTSQPAGQFRKPSCNKEFVKMHPDFKYISLDEGLRQTCDWFSGNYPNIRL